MDCQSKNVHLIIEVKSAVFSILDCNQEGPNNFAGIKRACPQKAPDQR